MKFDMHCHTAEGSLDGRIPLREYVQLLKENGFQGMLITDHNSYKAYSYYQEHSSDPVFRDFTILKGIEYDTLSCGHFLIVMPQGFSHPLFEIRGLPLPLLISLVHRYGGIIGPAHPFGEKFLSFGRSRLYKTHREIVSQFDFLEGYNCCESGQANQDAMDLAGEYHLTCFGGSDSHRPDNVGLAFTEFPEAIRTEDDLIRFVQGRGTASVGGSRYDRTLKARIGKWNNFLVYSYYPYNKLTALARLRKRRAAMQRVNSRN